MSERVDLREFISGFIAEADELVASSNTSLAQIEAANKDGTTRPRAVRDLFRALHTIKGLAGMVGVEPIVEIAHALETLVRNADRAGGQLARAAVVSCRLGVDAIAERIRAVAEGRKPDKAPRTLVDAIANSGSEAPAAAPATELEAKLASSERAQLAQALAAGNKVWTVTFFPSDEQAARGVTIATVRAQLAAVGDIIKVLPRALARTASAPAGISFEILIVSQADASVLAAAGATTVDAVRELPAMEVAAQQPIDAEETPGLARTIVRVDLARLDALQEQLSLLIVSRFRLQRELAAQTERGHDVRALREIVDIQGRQLRDLRRAILQARLVRATEVLEPLSLLVRSLARTSNKDVAITIDAGASELDKSVADRLVPALVHLVRNAVDHAIESVEERTAAGKPATGQIRIVCREVAGNQIEIALSDDGRGVNREAVARKAQRTIDDNTDLLDAIAQPGFSTRAAATATSGRGLGMDIVRRIITSDLRGELSMVTGNGTGTTFTLRVPVTIAVMDVFSFACGEQTFVVPVSSIEEIFEVDPSSLVAPSANAFALVERRGRAIPIVPLAKVLAIGNCPSTRNALLIRRGGETFAFGVDKVIGRQEVVVRAIDDPLLQISGIAGATDLGDGAPTIVLDLVGLDVSRERHA